MWNMVKARAPRWPIKVTLEVNDLAKHGPRNICEFPKLYQDNLVNVARERMRIEIWHLEEGILT